MELRIKAGLSRLKLGFEFGCGMDPRSPFCSIGGPVPGTLVVDENQPLADPVLSLRRVNPCVRELLFIFQDFSDQELAEFRFGDRSFLVLDQMNDLIHLFASHDKLILPERFF